MFFYPDIFLYATILLVALFSVLVVGVGCVKLLPELYSDNNPFANVFVCLMSGYITVVTVFALIIARCNSVMIFSVIIILFYVLFVRNRHEHIDRKSIINKNFLMHILIIIGLLLVLYFVSYYIFFVRTNGQIWSDYPFYTNVCCHVIKNHCENSDVYSNVSSATNYHWGDLWFTSLFGFLFKANYLYVLLLVTYPFFDLICIVGGSSVVYQITKRESLSVISGIGLLFAVPILTIIIRWTTPVVVGKIIVVYCFVVLSLLFYNSGRLNLSYVSLLLLVPFYSTVAPGVLTMVCVLSIIEEFNNGVKAIRCIFSRVVLFSVFLAVSYVFFYYFQDEGVDENIVFLYDNYLNNSVGFAIKRSCRVLLLIPSVAGLWYMLKNKKDIESMSALYWVISAVFGVVASSIVGGCVRQVMLDGGQITTNYSGPIFNITCWFLAIYLFYKIFNAKYLNTFVLSLVTLYTSLFIFASGNKEIFMGNNIVYTEEEISKIEKLRDEINSDENAIGYYRNYKLDENFNTHKSRIKMYYPMDKMPHLTNDGYYAPYCLSALDIPNDLEPRWNEKKQSQLYKYIEQMKMDGSYINEDEAILSFIDNKNIRFIVVESGCKLPRYLDGNVVLIYDGSDKVYKVEETIKMTNTIEFENIPKE